MSLEPRSEANSASNGAVQPMEPSNDNAAWDHDDLEEEEEEEGEEEEEDDADEEAEEIARRLGDQLWAEISRAQAEAAASATAVSPSDPPTAQSTDTRGAHLTGLSLPVAPAPTEPDTSTHVSPKKIQAAIETMKSILAFASKDPLAHSTLRATLLPESSGVNVLDVLVSTVSSGALSKAMAKSLSHLLVSLARSDVLFSSLRHSNASSIQLRQGKRKRDEHETDASSADNRAFKRPTLVQYPIHSQMEEACRVITNALSTQASREEPLNPALISSIQYQLHQVFLFSVTSATQVEHERNALQEIGGLIQVLGVLSGIQIGGPPAHAPPQSPFGFSPNPSAPWPALGPSPVSDIGTAVYPCVFPSCNKTFSRLYSLRAHQRVHSAHRPYHCDFCPASFARNHDLKRHMKLHDRKAWKCTGCDKVFSRRDAIKRHKNSAGRGPSCADADILEVEVDKAGGEDEMRRTKLWSGFAAHQPMPPPPSADGALEEGEIGAEVIRRAQAVVLRLHVPLQECVARALGGTQGHALAQPLVDPTGSQATLASVIARAQTQTQMSIAVAAAPAATKPEDIPSQSMEHQHEAASDHVAAHMPEEPASDAPSSSLSMYNISAEQALLIEQAIANAATAAQLQAEAEAALEEEDIYEEEEEEEEAAEDD